MYVGIGKRHNFVTDRKYIPVVVRSFATRTKPSAPGCNSMIRPSDHSFGGNRSSRIKTKSFSFRFGSSFLHFGRACKCDSQSDDHRRQNIRVIRCNSKYCLSIGILYSVAFAGSGGERSESPIKKWPGVRAVRSSRSADNGHNGLELRHDSILVSSVDSSS